MKNIFLFLLIILQNISYGQHWTFEKPDYKSIEKNIKKKKSNLFYPSLMNRFLDGDSTMTLEEKRHLYYGFSFSESYFPYSSSDFEDSLKLILNKEDLDSVDFVKIMDYSDKMLQLNPFDLDAFDYQLYSLEKMGNTNQFNKRMAQMNIIVDALISSGNGKSKSEAIYVIYVAHEYALLNIFGFRFGGSQSLNDHFDYLSVAENEANLEGLYFDISPCLLSLSKMFKK